MPSIALNQFEIDAAVIKLVPAETARKYQIVPLSRAGATLTIAMTDPTNVFAMDDVKFMTGYNVEPVVASETALVDAIEKYYGSHAAQPAPKARRPEVQEPQGESALDVASRALGEMPLGDDGDVEVIEDLEEISAETLARQGEEAPVIKLVNVVLMSAISQGRQRHPHRAVREGIPHPLPRRRHPLQHHVAAAEDARRDHLARQDHGEARHRREAAAAGRPHQDPLRGQRLSEGHRLPRLVPADALRRKDRHASARQVQADARHDEAGVRERSRSQKLEAAINKPWGMVLVTGPTGSGKTNTLYSSISKINTPETNIMTAEDPVEFNLLGVNQVQVRENIGLNFAAALRSFLRQDPNIILVGEIRDFETAEIAVKAALTGHLVLSTLHTNDAPSTINRLMNMGIEPFLVASSLNLVCAQRLVRRVCTNCKVEESVAPQALEQIGFTAEDAKIVKPFKGTGCDKCNKTGYKGRVGLYEVMEITDELRELILVGASALELRRKAIEEGMITLRGSGLQKIKDGVTSIEEVLRETVR